MTDYGPIDFTFRVIESIAFSIHSILGITEPCTGCLRSAFGDDRGALPTWFWPLAGLMLMAVALINFSQHDALILTAQAYIATFHFGAGFYHVHLGHHPAVGVAPGVFAVFAFIVTSIRSSIFVAMGGIVVCWLLAWLLAKILLRSPETREGRDLLDRDLLDR